MIPKFKNIMKLLSNKVDKATGKSLSTNDFTNTYKTKLDGIATGATKNTVENVLTSTSTANALSANQGRVLNTSITNLKPVSLYNNSSGTTGTVTLSETAANFSYLEIFYCKEGIYNSSKIHTPHGKKANLILAYPATSTIIQLLYKNISVSGTSITVSSTGSNNMMGGTANSVSFSDNSIIIYKVVGYR